MVGVNEKLAAVRAVKQAIATAETVDALRAPLLTLIGLLELDAQAGVVEADLILGRRGPSDTHRP